MTANNACWRYWRDARLRLMVKTTSAGPVAAAPDTARPAPDLSQGLEHRATSGWQAERREKTNSPGTMGLNLSSRKPRNSARWNWEDLAEGGEMAHLASHRAGGGIICRARAEARRTARVAAEHQVPQTPAPLRAQTLRAEQFMV